MTAPMALRDLIPTQIFSDEIANIHVGDLRLDSRLIQPGDVFVSVNGDSFIEFAIEAGAVAVLVDSHSSQLKNTFAVPLIAIENIASQCAWLAEQRYSFNSDLHLMGVTGTNGKSTLVSLVAQLIQLAAAKSAATLGTLGAAIYDPNKGVEWLQNTGMTTPDIFTNRSLLKACSDAGVALAAMEVSSHGLAQGRVKGLPISTAVFTNLTQDHLDYHGTFSAYADAKKTLFAMPSVRMAIFNADDANTTLMRSAVNNAAVLTYGIVEPADIFAKNIIATASGTRFELVTPWGGANIQSPLLGVFNIYNLLAAIAVVGHYGLAVSDIAKSIARLESVPGRMQQLPLSAGIKVIVDFAHTPDGLEQALLALRDHIVGRIWVVFGCGGDRDKQKRALMGAIAEDLADEVIITSDNPRSENPQTIISDVAAGCKNAAYQIVDRQEAIAFAIEQAQVGDCILIAGKGHESYQIIQDKKIPFCDVTVASELLLRKTQLIKEAK